MAKELANCKSLDLGKPCYLQKELGALLGMGILTSNGDLWLHERKVIAPEFFMGKVKGMVNLMVEAGNTMLNLWESEVEKHDGGAEMVVDEYLRNLSADVISRASFGSSFAQGKEIFNKIRQLQMLMAKQTMLIGVPSFRYLPTKSNREIWSLDTSIRNLILNIAKNHDEHDSATHINNDFLHSIIEGAKGGPLSSCTPEDFIVDNCKNIYFAGHETTSTTATWCLLLLASHPKWQSSARGEVLEVCQGNSLQADMLQKLKTSLQEIRYLSSASKARKHSEKTFTSGTLSKEDTAIEVLVKYYLPNVLCRTLVFYLLCFKAWFENHPKPKLFGFTLF